MVSVHEEVWQQRNVWVADTDILRSRILTLWYWHIASSYQHWISFPLPQSCCVPQVPHPRVSSDLSVPSAVTIHAPLISPSYQQWSIPFPAHAAYPTRVVLISAIMYRIPIRATFPTISSALQLQYCVWLNTSMKKAVFLDFLALEDGTDRLSWNVGKVLRLYAAS